MNQKSNRTALVLAIFLAFSFGASRAGAQESPLPLSRKLATHLIADFFEIGENEVKIAFIIDGRQKKSDFESDYGAEVTYLTFVVEDGRRRRMVQKIRFQHDAELGWFLNVIVEKDGRDYIDICSEHQGRIRIE